MKRIGAWLALGAVVSLAAVACGSSSAASARPTLSACVASGVPARCGYIKVPENPAAPAGRQLSLHVVVVPASGTQPAADPLFYFAGGPGSAGTQSVATIYRYFYLLHPQHDMVFVDQRGTGASGAVSCDLQYPDISESGIHSTIDSCLASVKDKADPAQYTTPISADDFDLVRAALGYDKIDIYGISYGVSSGLAYVQRHGDHVRTAVFDSGSLLDVHLWERVPVSAQHSLDAVFARCAAVTACHTAFPDVVAEFNSLMSRLAQGPLPVDYVDPATGATAHVSVDRASLLNFLIDGYLRSVDTAAALPKAIHLAARGDWTDLFQAFMAGQAGSGGSTLVMSVSIECSDAWASYDTTTVEMIGKGSAFTPATLLRANIQNTQCKYWPQAVGASGPVRSSAPIVFLNGTADPADPPANVAGAASTMPNSISVEVPEFGHGVLDQDVSMCLGDKVTEFIAAGRPSTVAAWQSCPNVLPPFVTE